MGAVKTELCSNLSSSGIRRGNKIDLAARFQGPAGTLRRGCAISVLTNHLYVQRTGVTGGAIKGI
eukprot:436691-Rhodomonas_salina.1